MRFFITSILWDYRIPLFKSYPTVYMLRACQISPFFPAHYFAE
jgi:hypothetical protein